MRLWKSILLTYLLLVVVFTATLTAAFSIPTSAIEGNVRESVNQAADGGKMFTAHVGMWAPWKLGTFSDCLILGIAYCADADHPLQSAMNARFVMQDSSPIAGALQMVDHQQDGSLQSVVYSRYWHGNQVIVRPLLCLTTLRGIRLLNVALLGILLIVLLVVMCRKTRAADALIVTLSLAAVMYPAVPMCLNYVPTFYIALLASLLILLWGKATTRWEVTTLLFFTVGAVTAYMDLLTTPMVSMAVPLTVYLLYRHPERPCRALIVLALAWLGGYASLWATKWVLAALITGHAALQDAMGAVTQRTVGHDEHDYMLWCLKWTLAAVAVACAMVAAVSALLGNCRETLRRHGWMLLMALSGIVWVTVLLEHTWHHLHFTWRTLVVTVIGVLLYWSHAIEYNKGASSKEMPFINRIIGK